ncbi:hypothetical protein HIM_04607 [Hirsutella minnesotensis 3608]|uniref:AMP-dependent synthetase/ligase domain-containing protein n=1 Tax=Hirsutella minnesotensis 3608 TaxID=1043627 RepID=A0A0F7ZL99_9HYPO|nr:hypothetical protein HIM_04607 [Hirsutella minnesotensis 3608]
MASSLPSLPVFRAIAKHDPASPAVLHSVSGRSFTYGDLLGDVARARDRLREARGGADLNGERIAFLVENSYDYVVTLLAVLAARSIAVPLSPAFPASELEYILNHSEASLLVSSAKFASKADEVLATALASKPAHFRLEKHIGGQQTREDVSFDDQGGPGAAGLMLYTSGTTNRPKGVLLPQSVLTAQSQSLMEAWNYSPADRLLHVLPLHHIHGAINALLTPLFAGASIEFMFPFNADAVWKRLAAPFLRGESPESQLQRPKPITFFTVVPTVYSRLLASHASLPQEVREAASEAVSPQHMRLGISGSAALPTPVKAAWCELSGGNVLLERYGMTEVGMALSCGLDFADRVDASLRGPTIFQEYWRNPEATASEFVDDADGGGKWFKTGDVAIRRTVPSAGSGARQPWAKGPMYFIQGRVSADIIKTGGEKVSALEVERELLSLPEVAEVAVVAVPSGSWGQKVGAVVVLDTDVVRKWSPLEMRRALKSRLANYKIPQTLKVVDHIPRNAMGKINKKQLVKAVFADEFSDDE